MTEQRRNQAPEFNRRHLLSKRWGSIARTFESSLGPWFEFASRVFWWCVAIAESGLISALEPCSWVDVVCKCRVTRQLVVGVVLLKDSSQKRKFKIIHTVRMTIFAVFRKL